jgi:hypothetical protein
MVRNLRPKVANLFTTRRDPMPHPDRLRTLNPNNLEGKLTWT